MRVFGHRTESTRRTYAIGDIHGRFDLFVRLVAIIQRDNAARLPLGTRIILVGDIIDHGPDAKRLCELCRQLTERSDRFTVLKGDHEALMVGALRGDHNALELWQAQGGRETLESWGLAGDVLAEGGSRLIDTARAAVGEDMLEWLAELPLSVRHDDYLFVHAGIRPGVELKRQTERDMLWIRDDFLQSKSDHGAVVVHGHSVREAGPEFRPNRIGIDTGAFRTGRLTAVGLEGGEQWALMTEPSPRQMQTAEADAAYMSNFSMAK